MKLRLRKVLSGLAGTFLVIGLAEIRAGTVTWTGNSASTSNWSDATNWTANDLPNNGDDVNFVGNFKATPSDDIAALSLNSLVFPANAFRDFTIVINPAIDLTFTGTGTQNNSAFTQTFRISSGGAQRGFLDFANSASAGSNIVFSTDGASSAAGMAGLLQFDDNANAGSATITNNSGTALNARGGATVFTASASAANAIISNNGGTSSGEGGETAFTSTAKGGHASITNFASDGSAGSTGGSTDFSTSADAQMATIVNNGATMSGGQGGATAFEQNATAGDGSTITNNGAAGTGASASGRTFFEAGPATAGNSMINNLGGNAVNAFGGQVFFQDTSNAGTAHINNRGSSVVMAGGGDTTFQDGSSAANAIFVSDAGTTIGAGGGRVDFFNSSNAGHGNFTTNGAGSAGGTPGVTDFHNASSGDHGTFVSNGGTGVNAAGGQTEFFNSSFADQATLTANAGTMVGAFGAFTAFWEMSAANSATLIANGGLGQGGGIYFFNKSTGDTSRVEIFGNGFLDISDRDTGSTSLTVGSVEGTGKIFLGANNLIVGSNNLSTTFSGVMQDGGENGGTGGSLTKIGTGTLVLSGANTYTGGANIFQGVLQVDGSTASPVTVKSGGTLSGSGTIGGLIDNNGVVSPGPSAGTLTGTGSFLQSSGATLRIEIGGLAPSQHDLLQVAGGAGLAGTLQLLQLNNFHPANGDQVIIMTWGTNRSGQFAPVTDNFAGLVQPQIFYDQNDVRVVFSVGSFAGIGGLTPNQQEVANELDDVVNASRAADLISFLGNEPLADLSRDYDLIAPEELAAIYEIGFSQAVVQNNNLQRRMDDIRAGSNGFCANGFAPQISGKDYSKESDGKVSLGEKNTASAFIPCPENRWGVFAMGSGDFVNVGDDDSNARGYDITTGNFTLGADYRIGEHFAIGIDGGYSASTADLVNDGRVEVDGGKAGAYATVFGYKFLGSIIHIDGAVGGGWNNYDTRRTGLQDEPVRGNTNGSEFNALLAYGADWNFGCFTIGTWSSLQYTNVSIDSFTEEGSLAPLEIQDQDEDSFRGTSGIRASYDIKFGRCGIVRPEVRAAWQHEYGDQAYPIDARFASGAGDVFRVHGPTVGRDAALVGAGLNVQWNPRLSTYVYYDGVLGRSNYDNNAVSGGFRVNF